MWNTMVKPHLTSNIHLNIEGQEGKTGPFWECLPVGGGG
jgi:hypothetical protein